MISLESQFCLNYFISLYDKVILSERSDNLVPRVSHLTAPWSERGGGGKIRDPGNEVGVLSGSFSVVILP